MKKVCQRKNAVGCTRTVYRNSQRDIRNGGSLGFCVTVTNEEGHKKTTGFFNSVDEALSATWLTKPTAKTY
jgi:hypothetical protein